MAIGDSKTRVDTYAKVTGEAKYVADLEPKHAYVAKVVRSTIANGVVTGFDLKAAGQCRAWWRFTPVLPRGT